MTLFDFLNHETNIVSRKAGLFSGFVTGFSVGVILTVGSVALGFLLGTENKAFSYAESNIGLFAAMVLFAALFAGVFKGLIDGFFGVVFAALYRRIPSSKTWTKYFIFSFVILSVLTVFLIAYISVFSTAIGQNAFEESLSTIAMNSVMLLLSTVVFSASFKKFNAKYEVPAVVAKKKAGHQFIYASLLRRLGAFLIDQIISSVIIFLAVVVLAVAFVVTRSLPDTGNFAYLVLAFLLMIFISWGYPILFLGKYQQTLGMKALHIRLLRGDGSKTSFKRIFARELLFRLLLGFTLGLAHLWIIIDEKKQGLHDKALGTVVVREV